MLCPLRERVIWGPRHPRHRQDLAVLGALSVHIVSLSPSALRPLSTEGAVTSLSTSSRQVGARVLTRVCPPPGPSTAALHHSSCAKWEQTLNSQVSAALKFLEMPRADQYDTSTGVFHRPRCPFCRLCVHRLREAQGTVGPPGGGVSATVGRVQREGRHVLNDLDQ